MPSIRNKYISTLLTHTNWILYYFLHECVCTTVDTPSHNQQFKLHVISSHFTCRCVCTHLHVKIKVHVHVIAGVCMWRHCIDITVLNSTVHYLTVLSTCMQGMSSVELSVSWAPEAYGSRRVCDSVLLISSTSAKSYKCLIAIQAQHDILCC